MSEPKLISPLLDNFVIGDPISDHFGVRSCPAMDETSGNKYIVKIISFPASETQLDALLLTGAYDSKEQALAYYEEIANGVVEEISTLQTLSDLEGFMAFEGSQLVSKEDGNGYDVYLLGSYKMSLAKFFNREPITHLQALNLGLDLCAALTVCRRSGYLYVDLKPENIYLTTDNGFRIGDLGFIKLDTLKYASLPDRYRSNYTAPEVNDPFATLNSTIDIYAAGLILYQAFNAGQLPTANQDGTLNPPDYADYEMAEIILKACDPNPENRWVDPTQMGHALVDYMQRNGAHDTPIVPPTIIEGVAEETNEIPEDATAQSTEITSESVVESTEGAEASADAVNDELKTPVEDSEEALVTTDDEENDETLPGAEEEDIDLEQVSEEVSDIINQVDELLAHPTPDPVVAPEPVEVTLPEVQDIPAEDETEVNAEFETEEETAEATEDASNNNEAEDSSESVDENKDDEQTNASSEEVSAQTAAEAYEDDYPTKPKHRWLRYTILAVSLLALLAAAFIFYKFYYLQDIKAITCNGEGTELTVTLTTDIDNNLLTVICKDTYGNKLEAPVVNGVAVFKDLIPDSPYTILVEIDGFHKLTGKTRSAYATPKQTTVTDFKAYTGNEDGSVVLRFSVEGPDTTQWVVRYVADSGEEITVECTDHMATVLGLSVGTEYSFKLEPVDDVVITGECEITHVASKPIIALDLYAGNVKDGILPVYWSIPASTTVSEWTVRCYNENGYDQSLVVQELKANFEGVTEPGEYIIEVTASGMLTSQRITVDTSAVEITDFTVKAWADATILTWTCDNDQISGDWYVEYTIDSTIKQTKTGSDVCEITLPTMIPGARYKFVIGNGDTYFIGNVNVHTASAAEPFDSYGVTKDDVTLGMCYTPSYDDWNRWYLEDEDYSTTFRVGDSASFTISLETSYERSSDTVVVQVAIRDDLGRIVGVTTEERTWRSMWSYGEGYVDLPALPETPGQYTASVYMNGALVGEQVFTVNN